MQPAVVSSECPSCGAPLDFSEGSNAVRCQHCESHLLVTGRTQLLSYSIAPTVNLREAARTAAYECEAAGRPGRVREARLWLIPYYRMTGHDLRWEWTTDERESGEAVDDAEARLWARVMPRGMPAEPSRPDADLRRLQLRERHIEKSFLACEVEGLALPVSLGLRPTVLRLQLHRPEHAGTRVRVIAPTLAPERAWEIGLKAVGAGQAVYRRVLRQVLSLVYQPVWAVTLKAATGAVVLVDALTGKAMQLLDDHLSAPVPAEEPPSPATVIGLRPLVCPNCGWDFPLKADEIVAPCTSCWHAYAIDGSELRPVDYRLGVVAPPNGAETLTHLPFWVLDASVQAERLPLHIPAFRYRRLKVLVDLARVLAAKVPTYTRATPNPFSGRGVLYDQDDAAALAAVVLAGANPHSDRTARQLKQTPLEVHAASLVWMPYRHAHDALIDPFSGRAFAVSLLG